MSAIKYKVDVYCQKEMENKNAKVLKKRGMDNFILNSEFSLNKEKSFK